LAGRQPDFADENINDFGPLLSDSGFDDQLARLARRLERLQRDLPLAGIVHYGRLLLAGKLDGDSIAGLAGPQIVTGKSRAAPCGR